MMFPGVNAISDAISAVREAAAPVGAAFDAAVDGVRGAGEAAVDRTKNAAGDVITTVAPIVGAAAHDGARPLTQEERELASDYFGDSIDLDRVVINESSAAAVANQYFPGNSSSRPFVVGNTVNYAGEINLNDPIERSTFLHELTHVWQFQNTEGVNVQIQGVQLATDPSSYVIDTSLLGDVDNFQDFNIEQQAETVRGHFLLTRHAELEGELNGPRTPEQRAAIQQEIDQIERQRLFQNLDGAGITAADLEPFLDEVRSFAPREGVVAEANEALDEIAHSLTIEGEGPLGVGLEIAEGGAEVTREVGEIVLEETGDAIVEGVHAVDDIASDAKDLITGRGFRLFG